MDRNNSIVWHQGAAGHGGVSRRLGLQKAKDLSGGDQGGHDQTLKEE